MRFIPILCVMLICSCTATNKTKNSKTTEYYIKVANDKFGKTYTTNFNKDKTYVLCQKTEKENNINPNKLCHFFVMNLNTNKIDYEEKTHSATVSWYNENSLKITKQKGIIVSNEDNGKTIYIYDLSTKTRKILDTIKD